MKTHIKVNFLRVAVIATIGFILISDIIVAQAGVVHRTTVRRTAVVVATVTHEKDQQAAQQQQKTTQQQTENTTTTTSTTPPSTTSTTTPPPTTQTTGGALPIGTVVTALPQGCIATSVDNVEYYHCGSNYYRTAFQGNTLVYVTTDPPK